jgi:Glycoside hydrolase 97.
MRKIVFTIFCLLIVQASVAQNLKSPDGNLILTFQLNDNGTPAYKLQYKGKTVIEESKMGFIINSPAPFNDNFTITSTKFNSSNEVWQPVLGQQKEIRDNHNEMFVTLNQTSTNRKLNIRFRLFNDGLGFRYEFPVQEYMRHFTIKEEATEFNLTGNHKAFWIPADYDTNEFPVTTSKISEIAGLIEKVRKEPLSAKSPAPNLAIQTPLMLKSEDGLYINIHEAALVDFPAMALNVDDKTFGLSAHLTPDKNGNKGYIQTGNVSPWRTIVVSDDARDILSSNLILNLNDPCVLDDTSWIKPTKYIGVWWEYFTGGGSTWAYSNNQDIIIGKTDYSKA